MENGSALHRIIATRQGDASAARGAFTRAIAQAGEILAKTSEYYEALDAKGLALCGLALTGRGDPPGSPQALDRSERVARTQEAIQAFRAARKIAPHPGVVQRVLRLFDELAKCDEEALLEDVRAALEGITP